MDILVTVAVVVVSYFLGTIPSAIVVARSKGVDITTFGSGNPGASNVGRALGAKWGILVFVIDAAKGAVPTALMLGDRKVAYMCGAAAIVGHIFPVTRRLKGGKGIATGGGVVLALFPAVLAAALATWLVLMKTTKKASVGSIIAVPVVVAGLFVVGPPAWEIWSMVGLALLVEVRHLGNIKRLFAGSEPPVTGTRS
ncbi:MAG: glycerol-3-phosphate 1-O-acyltransferase PlsY [Ilumatobacteraceae bacterium]